VVLVILNVLAQAADAAQRNNLLPKLSALDAQASVVVKSRSPKIWIFFEYGKNGDSLESDPALTV